MLTDYSKMSDFEINCKVAKANNWTSKSFLHEIHSGEWNPCQNAADAWHIIDENNITIINDHPEIRYAVNNLNAYRNGDNNCIVKSDPNGLRAAMIVFLMMQDARNEK